MSHLPQMHPDSSGDLNVGDIYEAPKPVILTDYLIELSEKINKTTEAMKDSDRLYLTLCSNIFVCQSDWLKNEHSKNINRAAYTRLKNSLRKLSLDLLACTSIERKHPEEKTAPPYEGVNMIQRYDAFLAANLETYSA